MSITIEIMGRLFLTFLMSILLTYGIIQAFYQLQPHIKKWQLLEKPVFGGLAIYLSYWLNFFWLYPVDNYTDMKWGIFAASSVVLLTGLIDDWIELSPWKKSVGILFAGHLVFQMTEITFATDLLPAMSPGLFQLISYLLTITWIYFVTNAINLLDGLDGLASSVTIVSLSTLVIVTLFFSLTLRLEFLMMLLFMIAAILGFLVFNWPPAKIFLGDTGALFIGFMYASLTVTNLKNATVFSFVFPIIIYAVPLFDTVYAFVRRLLQGSSVTQGDLDHVHHRLLRRGLTARQVNYLMILLSLVFALLAVILQVYEAYLVDILLVVIMLVVLLVISMIKLGKTK